MKRINLFLVFLIVSLVHLFAQNKQLIGTYSFYHSTSNDKYFVVDKIETNGNISFRHEKRQNNGCCTQTATLELRPDFTFYMSYHNDQGDYDTTFEFLGIYVVNNDTLTMYSPVLATTSKDVPENQFRLSVKGNLWNSAQLQNFLNAFKFYSMDKNYKEKKIEPLYTIPDKDVDFEYDATMDTTISFVFNREDISDYFYCYDETYGRNSCIFNRSLLLKMSDNQFNYFQDFDSNSNFFWRINEFSFVIGDSLLKSIYQTSDETGKKYYYEFIKQKDKQ